MFGIIAATSESIGQNFELLLQFAQLVTTIVAIAAVIISTRSAIAVLREKLTEISNAVKDLGEKFHKLHIDVELLKQQKSEGRE